MSGWLITGARGMLGHDLVALLEREDEDVTGYGRGELDITDAVAVDATLRQSKPAVVPTAVRAMSSGQPGCMVHTGPTSYAP